MPGWQHRVKLRDADLNINRIEIEVKKAEVRRRDVRIGYAAVGIASSHAENKFERLHSQKHAYGCGFEELQIRPRFEVKLVASIGHCKAVSAGGGISVTEAGMGGVDGKTHSPGGDRRLAQIQKTSDAVEIRHGHCSEKR